MFTLSFYLVGMNTVDLYNVPSSAYKDGRITYRRSKTKDRRQDNAEISIKVESEMLPLLEKYAGEKKLFKFSDMYRDASTFNAAVNIGLAKISKALGEEKITAYYARHSWATIARNVLGASIDDIALCLNHVSDTHKVTNIYIEKDFGKIDEINRKIIDLINQKEL